MNMVNALVYNKALRYFKRCNIEALTETAKTVQTFFINEKTSEGRYYHHLPLKTGCLRGNEVRPENWNLPEDLIQELQDNFKELEENWSNALTVCCYDAKGNYRGNSTKERDFSLVKDKMLPPWYAFPLYDENSIFWRMTGEGYYFLFSQYLDTLSKEERAAYCEKYPMPAYFGGERPEVVFYYLKNQTQK